MASKELTKLKTALFDNVRLRLGYVYKRQK